MHKRHKALLEQYAHLQLLEYTKINQISHEPENTILFSESWPDGKILEMAAEGNYSCFLNSQNRNFESELLVAMRVQSNPRDYFRNPLTPMFKTMPTALILPFAKKEDKIQIVHKIDALLHETGSRLVQEHARIIFEELFMNAVFDAPAEAKKLGLPTGRPRNEIVIAYDSEKLIISCLDSYGSLDPIKLLIRMRDIYNNGTKNIINLGQRKGGAGIGCSLLHHYSSSMIIGVNPGVFTRVTCSIPLKVSQKNFYNLGKNLQIINLTNSGGSNGK